MNDITLYGYSTSPYVRKTAAFLYYKDLPFTHVPVNPTRPHETIKFTGGNQVPVLKIGDEWRLESSDQARWLDELFPKNPLYPPEHAHTIDRIDEWVSTAFIPAIFRAALEPEKSLAVKYRFWRLAAIVSSQTPLREDIRHYWPDLLSNAPFIKKMAGQIDMTEDGKVMQMRLGLELAAHIGDGPFMGGIDHPTLLDFAVFPQLVFGVIAGLEENLSASAHPVIKAWMQRVASFLPPNPVLIPDMMVVKSLSKALA